jgi:hypothetical protein
MDLILHCPLITIWAETNTLFFATGVRPDFSAFPLSCVVRAIPVDSARAPFEFGESYRVRAMEGHPWAVAPHRRDGIIHYYVVDCWGGARVDFNLLAHTDATYVSPHVGVRAGASGARYVHRHADLLDFPPTGGLR